MARTPSTDRFPAPSWLLVVPLLVLGLVWFMTRPKLPSSGPPRRYSAKRTAASSAPKLTAPAAPLPSSGPPRRWVTPRRGRSFEPLFLAATRKYGLPDGLLSRVAARESYYNPAAVSSAGALGIMQIMPKYHPDLDPGELALDKAAALDPVRAIPYAAKYLRHLYRQFGKWTLAVAAYNAGPTAVTKYKGVPPFAETRAYVAAILPSVGIGQPEPGVRYA